jgi:pyruvate dehydrogenase (quinone)
MRTADIVAEALIDWNVNVIFGLPGDLMVLLKH